VNLTALMTPPQKAAYGNNLTDETVVANTFQSPFGMDAALF